MMQQGTYRVLSAGGASVNADAGNIHVRIPLGGRLHPKNSVRQAGVLQVLPANVVKGFGSIRRSHAVDARHDEAQLGHRLRRPKGAKGFGRVRSVRAGVNMLNNGIALAFPEVGGTIDHSVNVRFAVAPFGGKWFRRSPAGVFQSACVGLLQNLNQRAVFAVAQLGYRRLIHSRPSGRQVSTVGGVANGVRAISFREDDQPGAVKANSAGMQIVRVLLRVNPAGLKPNDALFFIDKIHLANHPLALGDFVFHLTCSSIKQIQMIPAVSLRHPNHFLRILQMTAKLFVSVVNESGAGLVDDGSRGAGESVHADDSERLMASLIVKKIQLFGVRSPAIISNAPGVGKQSVRNRNLRLGIHLKKMRLGNGNPVAGLQIIQSMQARLQAVARAGLHQANLARLRFAAADCRKPTRIWRPIHFVHIPVFFVSLK